MASTYADPKRTNLNRILSVIDPHNDATLAADARASLSARADALEAQAIEVGPRDPRYATLRRQAELVRGAADKVA